MKKIPLSKGKFAIVDDEDFEQLIGFKWHLHTQGYAATSTGSPRQNNRHTILMHRLLVGAVKGEEVDHINMDKLDNRRINLRKATSQQNRCNRTKQSRNTSGYKGVVWNKKVSRWQVRIGIGGRMKGAGYFDDINKAALAYQAAAKKYHGEFARW